MTEQADGASPYGRTDWSSLRREAQYAHRPEDGLERWCCKICCTQGMTTREVALRQAFARARWLSDPTHGGAFDLPTEGGP